MVAFSQSGDDKSQPPEVRLARLAARQLVVSAEQLHELGFTRSQISWRVKHGRLHVVFHNVYAVGHTSLPPRAYLLAALLSAGPTAFLSHRSAAAAYRLRPVNRHEIHLVLPGAGRRPRPPLVFHRTRTDPHPADVRVRDGLRVAAPGLMLIQLAPTETDRELARLISALVGRRLLPLDTVSGLRDLQAVLARHHVPAKLRAALAGYTRPPRAKSELERAFDALIAPHPEIPAPQHNVHLGGWEIDRYWPAHRLAVELDGRPYHVAVAEMDRDRAKDIDLQKLGVRPVRIPDLRLECEPADVLADVRFFVATPPGPRAS